MLPGQGTRVLCRVSVVSANKVSLQELPQLIRIKLMISRFLEILLLSPRFQGGKCPFFPPCGRPWLSALYICWTQQSNDHSVVTQTIALASKLVDFTCSALPTGRSLQQYASM